MLKGFVIGGLALVVSAMLFGTGAIYERYTKPELRATEVYRTQYGPVTGLEEDGVQVFKGIPYAAPPVGDLRWRPPQPPQSWTKPLEATEFSNICPQKPQGILRQTGIQSEDCLYLNIWKPVIIQKKLPVMVWIHGGGFMMGSGSMEIYDGTQMAKEGVVVVTFNYRLGPFGFFAHPALSEESRVDASGNYGIMDQVAVLKWVQKNIAQFGGDSDNVTIFGESAGAVSVATLMTIPSAKGLFHKAISQSGAAPSTMRYLKRQNGAIQSAEQDGVKMARSLGVKSSGPEALKALRNKPARDILNAFSDFPIMPGRSSQVTLCVDGYVIPEVPGEVFQKGQQVKVPLLAGTTANEGALFFAGSKITTPRRFNALAGVLGPDVQKKVLELYPASDRQSTRQAFIDLVTDGFVAGTRRMVRNHSEVQSQTYLYQFDYAPRWAERADLGAFHGVEIAYVFGSFPNERMYNKTDRMISDEMRGYWIRFAKTGDPNGGAAPNWPKYVQSADQHLAIGERTHVGMHLRKKYCDWWDSVRE